MEGMAIIILPTPSVITIYDIPKPVGVDMETAEVPVAEVMVDDVGISRKKIIYFFNSSKTAPAQYYIIYYRM